MELDVHDEPLALCRLPADAPVPAWADRAELPLVAVVRTGAELSLVVPERALPDDLDDEDIEVAAGWQALSVRGPLDLSLTGVLAALADALAGAGVPLLAIGTYDTDWLLVGADRLAAATSALEAAGHRVHRPDVSPAPTHEVLPCPPSG